MLEIIKQFRTASFYHPVILCLVGRVFINENPNELELLDNLSLLHLGAYLINSLKGQTYEIDEIILNRIAYAKRWDVTIKTPRSFETRLQRSAGHYLEIINLRLKAMTASGTLHEIIYNFLLKVLECAPQKFNEFSTIKTKISKDNLDNSIVFLVDKFDELDAKLKDEELTRQFQTFEDLYQKCALSIFMARNLIYGLNMEAILDDNIRSFTKDQLIVANLEGITYLGNYIIDQITKNGFFDSLPQHAQCVKTTIEAVNGMQIEFCRNTANVTRENIQELKNYIDQLSPFIDSDFNNINIMWDILNQLVTRLKTDPINSISTDLIAAIESNYKKISDLKVQLEAFKSILQQLKYNIESLDSALPLSSTEMYLYLHQVFHDFDERFAKPPQSIIDSFMELHKLLDQVLSFVIKTQNIIEEKQNIHKKSSKFNTDYLSYHAAVDMLRELRLYKSSLNEKFAQFNFEKDKCSNFEDKLAKLSLDITDLGAENEITPIQKVFNAATRSYRDIWQAQLRCVYTTNVITAVGKLQRNLQELENKLSSIVNQQEKQLLRISATPNASLGAKHFQRTSLNSAVSCKGKLLFNLFNASEPPNHLTKLKIVKSEEDKENCHNPATLSLSKVNH